MSKTTALRRYNRILCCTAATDRSNEYPGKIAAQKSHHNGHVRASKTVLNASRRQAWSLTVASCIAANSGLVQICSINICVFVQRLC